MRRFSSTLKSSDLEILPFSKEINEKKEAFRKYADAASMERIRSMVFSLFPFSFFRGEIG